MTPADDPDPTYCDYLAAATEAGCALDTPVDLPPALRRAHHLLAAVRAAGRLSSSPSPPPDPVAMPRRVGRFELGKELGRGGAGAVFEARDPTLGRTVALKLLHPALALRADWAARFRAEGPALAKLRHPNVVQVFEAGEADGVTFLAMELVPGPDLHTRLDDGPLPARAAAELVAALAAGLAHAHAAGLLHRDLKPHNVLLDPAGGPKIADFGLAAPLDGGGTGLTATGEVVGTPNYLAPESLDGVADARTDVYGLGAVLYECLTGRPPFVGANPAIVLMQVRTADPVSPRALNPEVPPDLDTVCRKCLAKRPDRRYPTAAALAADLRAFLAGRPVTARPPGPGERFVRWVVGRPARAAGALAALVALVAVSAALAGWALHTRRLSAALDAERVALTLADRRGHQLQESNAALAGVFADLDIRAERRTGEPLPAVLARRLVEAGQRLDAAADPAGTARMRVTLGAALRNLGHPAEAVVLLEQARPVLVEELGSADALAIDATVSLASAYDDAGQTDRARPLFFEAARLADARLGPDHRSTLAAWSAVAATHMNDGEYDRAATVAERVAARWEATAGPNAPETLAALGNLATCYGAVGRHAEALDLGKQVLARRRASSGPDHPDTVYALQSLAACHLDAGHAKQAVATYREALALSRKVLGDGHPDAVTCAAELADALTAAGRAKDAVPVAAEAVRLAGVRLRPDHPSALAATAALAAAYSGAGDPGRAVTMLEGVVRTRTAAAGPVHADTVTAVSLLAEALEAAGRPSDALPLHERAAAAVESGRFRHRAAIDIVRHAVAAYEEAGQSAKVEGWGRKLIELVRTRHGADSPDYAEDLSDFGDCLVLLKKYEEAERTLLAAHAAAAKLSKPGRLPATAAARLADLYAAWGRPAPGGQVAGRPPGRVRRTHYRTR